MPWLLAADDHWVKFTRGPFEVMTDAGARPGRETMVRFEQFRAALGQIVGEDDLQAPLPLRIFVFKNTAGWTSRAPITEGRDHFCIVLGEKGAVTPEIYSELTRLFLKSNTAQMPPAFERGLIAFFSTFEVSGIRITAGKAPAQPDLDWARIHLMVGDPDYYGKIRVLLYNLRHGVAEDPSYRNAFGKSAAEVETAARQHLAAGNFQTTRLPSRPMAEGDFPERQVSSAEAGLARGDLLAGAASAAEYRKLLAGHEKIAEAEEGLGLMALAGHRTDEAREDFEAAVEAHSTSARCYIEYAKLEPDRDKAEDALLKAAGLNPKLAETFALMAERDTDSRKRLMHWKSATERDPRNTAYWKALAETYLDENNYGEAGKAWRSAEQAATDPAEREKFHRARMLVEQQRLDHEEAEKRQEAEEKAREIAKLKSQAIADLHKAEARYSDGTPVGGDKPVPWWEGPKPEGRVSGTLKQVDCLPKQQARLSIEDASHKIVKLLVADPAKVVYTGNGEVSLGCGAQKARRITVEYFPKANARLATAGEVAAIDFQ
jgi:DNA-binding SARP family transcriptional activator